MKFRIWCEVPSGVTGRRSGWIRHNGDILFFTTREEAEALLQHLAVRSLASYTISAIFFRLFGGDGAHQRAQLFATEKGLIVNALGTANARFSDFGLDPWGRNPADGVIYSYVAVQSD
jgi:hypothetical protein